MVNNRPRARWWDIWLFFSIETEGNGCIANHTKDTGKALFAVGIFRNSIDIKRSEARFVPGRKVVPPIFFQYSFSASCSSKVGELVMTWYLGLWWMTCWPLMYSTMALSPDASERERCKIRNEFEKQNKTLHSNKRRNCSLPKSKPAI